MLLWVKMPSGKEIGRGLDLPQLQYGTIWLILFKKFVKFAKQKSEFVVWSDKPFLAFDPCLKLESKTFVLVLELVMWWPRVSFLAAGHIVFVLDCSIDLIENEWIWKSRNNFEINKNKKICTPSGNFFNI